MSAKQAVWEEWFQKIESLSPREKEEMYCHIDLIGTLVSESSRQGMSINKLSESTHLSDELIEKIFQIKVSPDLNTLYALAKALGYKIELTRIEQVFHPIKEVSPQKDFVLHITFENGSVRIYDVKSLVERLKPFKPLLASEDVFRQVKVDFGGFGISWNESLDLYCEELWENSVALLSEV